MKILLTAIVLLTGTATPTLANVYLISGNGDPRSAVVGGAQTSFADVGEGTYTDLTTDGIAFTAGEGTMFDISADYDGQFNNMGASLQGTFDGDAFQSLTLSFTAPVQALAFNFGGADTNWLLEAFDSSGQSLGTVTLLPTRTGNEGTFYGIGSSDQNIASGRLFVDLANYDPSTLTPDYVFVDNVATGQLAAVPAVPEPGEWAMMMLGLAVVGGVARRRKTS